MTLVSTRDHAPILRALSVVLGLVAALVVGAAAPADAAEGFTLDGRGNGHGIGLSQYGAQGQALEGRSARKIIRTYYAGADVQTKTVDFLPRIGVGLDTPRAALYVRGAKALVTIGDDELVSQVGDRWEISMLAGGGCKVIHPDGSITTGTEEAPGCPTVNPRTDGHIELHLPRGGELTEYRSYGRSAVVEAIPDQVGGVWKLDVVVELPLEEYLYGLAEMPYAWEPAALEAQAIAGRSYAMYRLIDIGDSEAALAARGCSCHLYDSQQDQVYGGHDRESLHLWSRWKAAVDATAGTVVAAPGQPGTNDDVVQAFYSSSSNGRTEAKHELWGGAVYPYLVSVDDPWTLGSFNPWRSWTVELPEQTIAAQLGLEEVDTLEITERSTSGAATEVVFSGSDGGSDVSVTRTGSWVRSVFGLRSSTIEQAYLPPFTDDEGSQHESDIIWLAAQGITGGCNSEGTLFCPTKVVTRAQMAAFLTRALDLPPGTATFDDTAGHTFEADIAAFADAGITRGCASDGSRFCPDEPVTRAQMATFLLRAMDLEPKAQGPFTDIEGSAHARSINRIAAAGITKGCNSAGTRYCPDSEVTRQQMASFLRRALG